MSQLPFPHQHYQPLSEFSTLGVGGPARYFAIASSVEQMQEMVGYAHRHSLPLLILGKGSNCLFDDRGFNGLVILNRIDFLEQSEGLFTVGAGFSFTRLGQISARQQLSGLEFAAGIPATVGGAIFMNAGASGQQTMDCLTQVDYVTEKGELIHFHRSELHFGYRTSSFQRWGGAIVVALFALAPKEAVKKEQRELLDYRLKTQPYKDKSAGCAFRNPLNGSAGQLIEACGLKGVQVGGAQVSTQHANFVINAGGATAHDIETLLTKIKEEIYAQKGIVLEEEVRRIGYE